MKTFVVFLLILAQKKMLKTKVLSIFKLNTNYAASFLENDLTINRNAIVITTPIGRRMRAFWISPANTYIANEIPATLIAYGNCVET